jgi:hypothetical protein
MAGSTELAHSTEQDRRRRAQMRTDIIYTDVTDVRNIHDNFAYIILP